MHLAMQGDADMRAKWERALGELIGFVDAMLGQDAVY
jgi:hypothetical protein